MGTLIYLQLGVLGGFALFLAFVLLRYVRDAKAERAEARAYADLAAEAHGDVPCVPSALARVPDHVRGELAA